MLIWWGIEGFLFTGLVLGLVMLVRKVRGQPVFTEHDWLFLFGQPRSDVLAKRYWLRFGVLFLAVALLGLSIAFFVLPYGLRWFTAASVLVTIGVLIVTPKWLR